MKCLPHWPVGTDNGILLTDVDQVENIYLQNETAAAVPWPILVLFYCVLSFYSVLHRKKDGTPEGWVPNMVSIGP